MTERKLYGATFGPYTYLDDDVILDPDGDFASLLEHASVSDGGHLCAFLDLLDTNHSHHLNLYWNEDDSANRTLAFLVDGGDRVLTFSGNLTVESASIINQDVTTDEAPTFGGLTRVGGASNYLAVSAGGLMTFVGASGLLYGGCYGDHIGWSVAASQNVWYNIVDASIVDGELRGVTHDGNGKLTVTEPGMWMIQYNITLESNVANEHLDAGIEINDSGSADAKGISHIEIKFANQEEHLSGIAILDLADNATIEIAVRTTDTDPGPTISVQDVHVTAVLIGGT